MYFHYTEKTIEQLPEGCRFTREFLAELHGRVDYLNSKGFEAEAMCLLAEFCDEPRTDFVVGARR